MIERRADPMKGRGGGEIVFALPGGTVYGGCVPSPTNVVSAPQVLIIGGCEFRGW